jgi:hypothetical protein
MPIHHIDYLVVDVFIPTRKEERDDKSLKCKMCIYHNQGALRCQRGGGGGRGGIYHRYFLWCSTFAAKVEAL